MNEHAWKEQAARVLAASDGLNYDEVCGVDADPDNGYCDSGTCVAAFYEDHDADHARVMYDKHAVALYPLVQQAIAAERGEPVAVPHVVYDMKMPPYHYQKPYTGSGGSISVPSAHPTEAQIRADERERCAKVAERYVGSDPPRYESGIERRATTSQQADNCINAMKVRAAEIAAAIRSLKEADNGAGNECICPKCGLRHGGKVDSGAVF